MTLKHTSEFNTQSIIPTINELERAAQWFTDKYQLDALADQKHVVIIYTGPKPAKCYGWFKGSKVETENGKPNGKPTGKVLYPWYTKQGDGVVEIQLTGEYLNRPVDQILGTLFHEIVHATANAKGIQDVAASGRHNKKFADLCDQVGLDCTQDDKGSWNVTTMRPTLADAVHNEFQPNQEAFELAASLIQIKPKSENKLGKYVCECETGIARKGAEFRTYRAAVLNGKCYDCGADFTKVE